MINNISKQLLTAWKKNNKINLLLIATIPRKGFKAVPYGSRGRTVTEQLVHMNNVRTGWLYYHKTGNRPERREAQKSSYSKAELKRMFTKSGNEVADFLKSSVEGKTNPKMFGGEILNWFSYLLAHDSHHRGSIMLALKQNGMKLPDKVSLDGLWYTWMKGKK
jgi:uncharacterized damage-inducible protein DinB